MSLSEAEAKAALLSSLDNQREHVLGIIDGLADDALRRPVLPSGWSCLGLVQHLAYDVERFWFRHALAGEPLESEPSPDNAWVVGEGVSADTVLSYYRQQVDRANAIIAATPLDAAPKWWPDFFGSFRLANLQEMMLHVITETACHAGHLDAARELIDGRKWLVLT
jgi:uncharacterized damage-inducible protein DinB